MAELLGFSLDSVSCLCGIYLLLHFHSCVELTGVHFRLSPSVIYALLKYNFFKYLIYVHDMENDMNNDMNNDMDNAMDNDMDNDGDLSDGEFHWIFSE